MQADLFLRGLLIGLAIAAPVGPIGLLCIRRSLAGGFAPGFFTGLGAAAADGVYGAVAAFGLAAAASFLAAGQGWLSLGGGAALIALGISIALKNPPAPRASAAARGETLAGLAAAFGQTFVLTLANPATILSFLAIFAGLGLGGAVADAAGACAVVAGVFLGSAAWWLFLAGVSARLGRAIAAPAIKWINRASGAGVAAFGLAAVASFFLG